MAMKPTLFTRTRSGDIRASVGFRRERDGEPQSLDRIVPDGDTLGVNLDGSGSIRFLGIDTPEVSLKGSSVDSERWRDFFADPGILAVPWLEPELRDDLAARLGAGTAPNHARHAEAAEAALEAMVAADMAALGRDTNNFRFYVAFSYEVFDRYARLLAFLNRDQPDPNQPSPRPPSLNERMLAEGLALPYFIWPNVAPFRNAATVLDAIPEPGSGGALGQRGSLGRARAFIQTARDEGRGVFCPGDPLLLEAFELRYLADSRPPTRAVIDLTGADDRLLRAQSYPRLRPEDRLFIPAEFVPAFAARGWRLEGW